MAGPLALGASSPLMQATNSIKTVERHRQTILDKLGMRDRVELTRSAIRCGLIQP